MLLLAVPMLAQPAPRPTRTVPAALLLDGSGADVVRVPGARWIRLRFAEARLGGASRVVLTSLGDGAVQHLDARSMRDWSNTSAFFNGEGVRVEIVEAAGDDARIRIESVWTNPEPEPVPGPDTVCEGDDRVHTVDEAVGRIMPLGCTGWLISNGATLTAGHCAPGMRLDPQVLQFNVPPSLCTGEPVDPPPQDQYPIDRASIVSANVTIGDDWAVFTTLPNDGKTPSAVARGAFYRVTQTLVGGFGSVRITGYGSDDDPPGCDGGRNAQSQTEQTDVGPFIGLQGTTLSYRTDTTGGNSGSPVIYPATGITIGIHTNGGCGQQPFNANLGTAFANARLATAIQQYRIATKVTYIDGDAVAGVPPTGSVFAPYRTVGEATAGLTADTTFSMTPGWYSSRTGITIPKGFRVTIIAPVGDVTLGPVPPPR